MSSKERNTDIASLPHQISSLNAQMTQFFNHSKANPAIKKDETKKDEVKAIWSEDQQTDQDIDLL